MPHDPLSKDYQLNLAMRIARHIFERGVGPGETQRIALKGGTYPDSETDRGGLNEIALPQVIDEALTEYMQ